LYDCSFFKKQKDAYEAKEREKEMAMSWAMGLKAGTTAGTSPGAKLILETSVEEQEKIVQNVAIKGHMGFTWYSEFWISWQ
jgi:hypothetical protein